MEPSRVWKNLLSGKQVVSTVACPSCGAQVPEFRIHSHLDTCLTTIPEEEAAPPNVASEVHELSDGGGEHNQNHRRGRAVGSRGQGRGRGRGRKRREAAEKKGRDGDTDAGERLETGKKRKGSGDSNVEIEKEDDALALFDDDYSDFYQQWEYSVTGLDELGKATKEVPLSDLQKQKLLSSGVLTIERQEVSAMILQLDRLLADFQTSEGTTDNASSMSNSRVQSRVHNGNPSLMPLLKQLGVPEQVSGSAASLRKVVADRVDGTQFDQGEALEAWWEQWVTVEWPEGPLPSGLNVGLSALPQRLVSKSRADQYVHADPEKVEIGKSAAQETTATDGYHAATINSMINLNFSKSGGIIEGEAWGGCSELLIKSDRRDTIEVGMQSGSKTSIDGKGKTSSTVMAGNVPHGRAPRGEQPALTKATELGSRSKPIDVEHSPVAESSIIRARLPSPSRIPASNPAHVISASPGMQACPICNTSFPPNSSNRTINEHIDECLTLVADLLD